MNSLVHRVLLIIEPEYIILHNANHVYLATTVTLLVLYNRQVYALVVIFVVGAAKLLVRTLIHLILHIRHFLAEKYVQKLLQLLIMEYVHQVITALLGPPRRLNALLELILLYLALKWLLNVPHARKECIVQIRLPYMQLILV